jgi:hypothetical protein
MFKVHFPASTYLLKQVPFFGTNHFLKAYLKSQMLVKSAGLIYMGDGKHTPHSWAPTDKGLSPDPNEPDHPPWNHHPETGELLPGGMHPMEFIQNDLMNRYRMSPEEASGILEDSRNLFNEKHRIAHGDDANHFLPSLNDPAWQKVYVGNHYDHGDDTHMRVTRGNDPLLSTGERPLLTYFSNKGNLPLEGAATGNWIDGGAVHMNREIGEVLKARGVDTPENIDKLNYVRFNALKAGDLSGGQVMSIGKTDYEKYLETGMLSDFYLSEQMRQARDESKMLPEVHPHQLAQILPPQFFQLGQRKGLKGEQLAEVLAERGIDHEFSEEELDDMARTPFVKTLFQTGKQQRLGYKGTGAVGTSHKLFNQMIEAIGSSHDDENLAFHRQHAKRATPEEGKGFTKTVYDRTQEIVTHMSNAVHKRMMQGMSQEEATQQVLDAMSQPIEGTRALKPKDGVQENAISLVQSLLGHTGHEPFSLGDVSIPTDPDAHAVPQFSLSPFDNHQHPEHWHHRVMVDNSAPVGAAVREEPPAPMTRQPEPFDVNWEGTTAPAAPAAPAAPVRVQPPQPQQRGMSPEQYRSLTRPAVPLEQSYMQRIGLDPRQMFFDIGTAGLVQQDPALAKSSFDTGMDNIRKKIGYFDGFLRGER